MAQPRAGRTPHRTTFGADEVRGTTTPDGMTVTVTGGPDPRFGLLSPIDAEVEAFSPAGRRLHTTLDRAIQLVSPDDPTSILSWNETRTVNGRVFQSSYDAAARTWTHATPEGRAASLVLDSLRRPARDTVPGVLATSYEYDADGRLDRIQQSHRARAFAYDAAGHLLATTDPLGRSDSLFYDPAGRVTRQVIRDGREIAYGYDAAGNLTSLTPPGRPAHTFVYNALGLDSIYEPPDIGLAEYRTFHNYNLDRDLTRILRPDGLAIDIDYDVAGRIATLTSPRGITGYTYGATTGLLTGITAPGGEALSFAYDGALPTLESWAGTISGQVGFGYDDDFRLSSLSVNGSAVSYGYDGDGLLTSAGDLALNRDPLNGFLRSTHLGGVTTRRGHNAFGELSSDTAWAYKVQPRGDWDWKSQGYEDFGNFNYGATGAALLIPEQVLLRAAGGAQILSAVQNRGLAPFRANRPGMGWYPGMGHPLGRAPYGDDPLDAEWIRAGIRYYKECF